MHGMWRESSRVNRHPLQGDIKSERVVIVGTGETASFAHEYFSYDSPHEVVAFSAEAALITDDVYCGLPVVALEELAKTYPPSEYRTFVAVSLTQLNRLRRRLYDAVKAAGFDCVSYISSHAFVLPSVEIGENAFVMENVTLEHRARLGDNVFLGCGVCISHGSVMGDDSYAGPHAVVAGLSTVARGSFLGANSTVTDGISVAEDCIIGAGAVVLGDTKPRQVYVGNPARPTGRDSFVTFGVTSG